MKKCWYSGRCSLCVFLITLEITLSLLFPFSAYADSLSLHPIMRYSPGQRRALADQRLQLPALLNAKQIIPPGNVSLLPLMPYTPEERDQFYCGNCWVWAATGVVEISRSFQLGISERLSIQYMNSNFQQGGIIGASACYGGELQDFVNFYNGDNGAKRFIPWSNTNAYWADWNGGSVGGYSGQLRTNMPADRISLAPAHSFSELTAENIATFNTGEEQAINNIKAIIGSNRAVFFGFYLPNAAAWNDFSTFWGNGSSDSLFDYDPYNGIPFDSTGGGHAVLLVGYNDTAADPAEHYWLILNSWGRTANRPDGTFKIKMHMNYDNVDGADFLQNLFWQSATVNFVTPAPTPTPTPTPTAVPTLSNSILDGVVHNSRSEPLGGVIVNGGDLGLVRTDKRGEYHFYGVPNDLPYTLKFLKTGVTFQPSEISGRTSGGTQTAYVTALNLRDRRDGCTEKDTSRITCRTAGYARDLKQSGDNAISRLRKLSQSSERNSERRRILRAAARSEAALGRAYSASLSEALSLPSSVLKCPRRARCSDQSYARGKNSLLRSISRMRVAADSAASEIARLSPANAWWSANLRRNNERLYQQARRSLNSFPGGGQVCG